MDPATDWVISPGAGGGWAINFDGTNDYIPIGDRDRFTFGNGAVDSPFSLSAWVYRTAATASIVSKYASSEFEWRMLFIGDKLYFNTYDNSASAYVGRLHNTVLSQSVWMHVCGTYDGSAVNGGFCLYVNGKRVDDTNFSGGTYVAMENKSQALEIGREQGSVYAKGKMDDIAVFNRVVPPDVVALLAKRRGIAYETEYVPIWSAGAAPPAGTRRQLLLTGVGK